MSTDFESFKETAIMVEELTEENLMFQMKDLINVTKDGFELLIGLIQILMAECGFYLTNLSNEMKLINESEPLFDKRFLPKLKFDVTEENGFFTNTFFLRGYLQPSVKLSYIVINTGVLIVNSKISETKETYSTALKLENYVVRVPSKTKILNMKSLAIRFKNNIALPIRASILNNIGVRNPSLEGLPIEILRLIAKELPENNAFRIMVCKRSEREKC